MWWGILLVLLGVGSTSGHLIGANICPQEERYTVTSEQYFKKNVTIREFIWCLGVPPRCSKYRTELKDDLRILEEEKTKLIDKCCPGYEEDETNTFCVPVCSMCIHGECVKPKQCVCNAGYQGASCDLLCPTGNWGRNCLQECDCRNGAPCDPETGSCQCVAGWTGSLCQIIRSKVNHTILNDECQECNELAIAQNTEDSKEKTKEITQRVDLPTTRELEVTPHPAMGHMNTDNKLESAEEMADVPVITTSYEIKVNGKSREDENSEKLLMNEMRTQPKQKNINNYLFSSFVITLGLAIFIIFIALVTVLVARYKNRRTLTKLNEESKNNHENKLIHASYKNRNSFNEPLPDPPTFQNPVFTLVVEEKRNSFKSFGSSQNAVGLYNNLEEPVDMQYDYPPSTGSYRAASVPDPDSEPIYDEIPFCRRPVPVIPTNDVSFPHGPCQLIVDTANCNET